MDSEVGDRHPNECPLARRAHNPTSRPTPMRSTIPMEPGVGFEPTTSALQERRSGQLSYSGESAPPSPPDRHPKRRRPRPPATTFDPSVGGQRVLCTPTVLRTHRPPGGPRQAARPEPLDRWHPDAEGARREACRPEGQAGRVLAMGGAVQHSSEMEFTSRDRAILDFERSWWTESGPKEAAIRERFELSGARYYQILNELLESDEAYEYDPLVVRRLRRLRDRRRRARHEGYQATEHPGR